MKNIILILVVIFNIQFLIAQSLDAPFSKEDMKKDLSIFKEIRENANSGMYRFRTKQQIDSIYQWAFHQIDQSNTYLDFYNILVKLEDFEGSCHNGTWVAGPVYESMKQESKGYFPYPLIRIEGKLLMNAINKEIPLGAEILSINNEKVEVIFQNLFKYYTTDGNIIEAKYNGILGRFSQRFRFHYGLQDTFEISFRRNGLEKIESVVLNNVSYKKYRNNFKERYSKPYDEDVYKDWTLKEMYHFENLNPKTSILTINSFAIGYGEESIEHKQFAHFLDSIFLDLKTNKVQNLIIDIRHNGGGSDPNELVLYSYLTKRNFRENKSAWISFRKLPNLKYIDTKVPRFLRPLGAWLLYNRTLRKEFSINRNGRYYQNEEAYDQILRTPHKNAFDGKIYLLIGSEVASAGSNFAALLVNDSTTTSIGEETAGGYYGHNGHIPLAYVLPKSKIRTFFSIVNLQQYVDEKPNQLYGRGVLPNHFVTQYYQDFIDHKDSQMDFVLKLIGN